MSKSGLFPFYGTPKYKEGIKVLGLLAPKYIGIRYLSDNCCHGNPIISDWSFQPACDGSLTS
jgi:hypothetical protein